MKKHRVSIGTWKQRPGYHKLSWRDLNGKRRTAEFPKTRDGEADMRQFVAKVERDLNAGIAGPDMDMTFGDLADKFMAYVTNTIRSPTLKQYRSVLNINLLPGWKDKPLIAIRRAQVMDKRIELQGKRLAKGTVSNCLGLLRSIFKFGHAHDYVAHDPTEGIKKGLGQPEKSRRPLTGEEVGRFLKAAQEVAPEHLLHFATLLETGVRVGELFAIRKESIDPDTRTITVMDQVYETGVLAPPKSAKGHRPIRVSGEFMALVRDTYREREARGILSPWLLQPEFALPHPTKAQSVKARRDLRFAFKRVAKKANLPTRISPHWARHTYATDLLAHLEPLANVSGQLGHSRISTTLNIYIEAIPKPQSTAADDAAERRKRAMETADMTKVSKFAVRRIVAAP